MGRAATHILRLHGVQKHVGRGDASSQPIFTDAPSAMNPTDPRWVLAMRVREAMQGPLLPADRRDRLLKVGQLLGLTAFESNLVIAIVQDQSRRGGTVQDAAPSLAMVPRHREHVSSARQWRIGWLIAATLAAEVALMFWMFA